MKERILPSDQIDRFAPHLDNMCRMYHFLLSKGFTETGIGIPRSHQDKDKDDIVVHLSFSLEKEKLTMDINLIDETITNDEIYDCVRRGETFMRQTVRFYLGDNTTIQ